MPSVRFGDRVQAGRVLGEHLRQEGLGSPGGVVLGILRSKEYRDYQAEACYTALLGRPSEVGALDYWFATGLDETGLRVGFESAPEFFTNG